MTAIRRTARPGAGRLLVALGAVVALGACSGTSTDRAEPAPASPTGPSWADETTGSGEVALSGGRPLEPLGDAGTAAVQAGGFPDGGGPVAQLTDVRAAGHEGFDRFVLEFDGDDMPSYRVAYVAPPVTASGSGDPVEVEGEAFLQVDVTPASGVDLSGNEPEKTYTGPDRLAPPFAEVVTEAVATGDVEAHLTWVIGLEERVPFGIATLEDPLRLVVDVRHVGDGGDDIDPVGQGSTDPATAEGAGPPVVVTDVRLGAHDGFDRIVFEVAGDGQAGWDLRYVEEPRAPGSGHPVEVAGSATLALTLSSIALPPDAPPGVAPWNGPERQSIAGAGSLQELVEGGLFEGRYDFFVGLDQRRPFAVARFDDPQRVVVDVLHRQPEGLPLAERCTSPEGFSVAYPGDWAVNPGDVVPPCTRFGPDSFELRPGTDARIASVVVEMETVPYERLAEPRGEELSRKSVSVDGRDAVRVERRTQEGLYPAGTRITSYVVDTGADGRSLLANTVDLPRFDYERDVAVLDAMMETLEFDPPD